MKSFNPNDICWTCKGSGQVLGIGMMKVACRQCSGKGKLTVIEAKPPIEVRQMLQNTGSPEPQAVLIKRRGRPPKNQI